MHTPKTIKGDRNGFDDENNDVGDMVDRDGRRCTLSREDILRHLEAVEEYVMACDHNLHTDLRIYSRSMSVP